MVDVEGWDIVNDESWDIIVETLLMRVGTMALIKLGKCC